MFPNLRAEETGGEVLKFAVAQPRTQVIAKACELAVMSSNLAWS